MNSNNELDDTYFWQLILFKFIPYLGVVSQICISDLPSKHQQTTRWHLFSRLWYRHYKMLSIHRPGRKREFVFKIKYDIYIHTSDNLFCSNSSPTLDLSVKYSSQICHENTNTALDGTYLADFGIDITFRLEVDLLILNHKFPRLVLEVFQKL